MHLTAELVPVHDLSELLSAVLPKSLYHPFWNSCTWVDFLEEEKEEDIRAHVEHKMVSSLETCCL